MSTYFFYTAIVITASAFAHLANRGNTPFLRLGARWACFFTLLVPAALRYRIGTDYGNYTRFYESYGTRFQIMEPGFTALANVCHFFHLSPHLFVAAVSAITYALICFSAPRKMTFVVVLFYVLSFSYFTSWNVARQMLAVSILFYGLCRYYRRKQKTGIVCFIIACTVHYSAIAALPLVLFSHIKINNTLRAALSCFVAVVLLFTTLPQYIFVAAAFVSPRLGGYEYAQEKWKTGLSVIAQMIPAILLLVNSRKLPRAEQNNFLLNINALYFVLAVFIFMNPNIGRVLTTISFIQFFSLWFAFSSNKKYRQVYFYGLAAIFTAIFFRSVGNNRVGTPTMGVTPYRSIFNR